MRPAWILPALPALTIAPYVVAVPLYLFDVPLVSERSKKVISLYSSVFTPEKKEGRWIVEWYWDFWCRKSVRCEKGILSDGRRYYSVQSRG